MDKRIIRIIKGIQIGTGNELFQLKASLYSRAHG